MSKKNERNNQPEEVWEIFGYTSLLDMLINELPPNQPLYNDSGVWQVRSDDMEKVLFQQKVDESFTDFISRCHSHENEWGDFDVG